MKNISSLTRGLRRVAIVIAILGLGLWIGTGARIGWTQTSAVSVQRDEVTGIEYPVRQAAFLPGVEVPVLGVLVAAGLVGASLLTGRRARRA